MMGAGPEAMNLSAARCQVLEEGIRRALEGAGELVMPGDILLGLKPATGIGTTGAMGYRHLRQPPVHETHLKPKTDRPH